MNQIEAGKKENEILGTPLNVFYANIMGRNRVLMHDSVKKIYKYVEDEKLKKKIIKLDDEFYDIINKDRTEYVKIKAARLIAIWAKVIELTFTYLEKKDQKINGPYSLNSYSQMADILGKCDVPYAQILKDCKHYFETLTKNISENYDSIPLQIKVINSTNDYHKLINKDSDLYSSRATIVRLLFELIRDVFIEIESSIDENVNITI